MRKPRIHRPTSFYHVILRGNNGLPIFFSDTDRCQLCFIIQQGIERFDHRIHGFCFMSNHIHLIIQTCVVQLSKVMHHLGSHYARYINRTHKRIGHLFQGRFKSILVDENNYLSELVRYVHLNPVRAGIVLSPENYPWSGHLAYIGLKEIAWLYQDWILSKFHSDEIIARQLYTEYLNKGIGENSQEKFTKGSHQGRILGNDLFFEKTIKKATDQESTRVTLNSLIMTVVDTLKISLTAIKSNRKTSELSRARGIITFLVREHSHITLKELALFLEKDHSSLIRLASRTEGNANENSDLAGLIDHIRANIYFG